MTLYYSPGAVSLAVHIVLRELDHPVELVAVPTGEEAHIQPEYLAINPMARVPTLVVDGRRLTEVPAILMFLGDGTDWVPSDRWGRATAFEWMSQIASMAHPPYRMGIRPDRWLGADAGEEPLAIAQAQGRREFQRVVGNLDARLSGQEWALGDRISVVDPYLAVMWMWARFAGLSTRSWPHLSRIAVAVMGRSATQAALRAEGLVDADGTRTPPTRV